MQLKIIHCSSILKSHQRTRVIIAMVMTLLGMRKVLIQSTRRKKMNG
jgi:hypothetical protein